MIKGEWDEETALRFQIRCVPVVKGDRIRVCVKVWAFLQKVVEEERLKNLKTQVRKCGVETKSGHHKTSFWNSI